LYGLRIGTTRSTPGRDSRLWRRTCRARRRWRRGRSAPSRRSGGGVPQFLDPRDRGADLLRARALPHDDDHEYLPAGNVWILPERVHYIGFPAFISSREGVSFLCPENDGEGGRHEEGSGAGARRVPRRRGRRRVGPRRGRKSTTGTSAGRPPRHRPRPLPPDTRPRPRRRPARSGSHADRTCSPNIGLFEPNSYSDGLSGYSSDWSGNIAIGSRVSPFAAIEGGVGITRRARIERGQRGAGDDRRPPHHSQPGLRAVPGRRDRGLLRQPGGARSRYPR